MKRHAEGWISNVDHWACLSDDAFWSKVHSFISAFKADAIHLTLKAQSYRDISII
jgi:hypothetical protein